MGPPGSDRGGITGLRLASRQPGRPPRVLVEPHEEGAAPLVVGKPVCASVVIYREGPPKVSQLFTSPDSSPRLNHWTR